MCWFRLGLAQPLELARRPGFSLRCSVGRAGRCGLSTIPLPCLTPLHGCAGQAGRTGVVKRQSQQGCLNVRELGNPYQRALPPSLSGRGRRRLARHSTGAVAREGACLARPLLLLAVVHRLRQHWRAGAVTRSLVGRDGVSLGCWRLCWWLGAEELAERCLLGCLLGRLGAKVLAKRRLLHPGRAVQRQPQRAGMMELMQPC